MVPLYPGSSIRARDQVQALQAYYQQQQPSSGPAIQTVSGTRQSSSHRGTGASSVQHRNRLYFVPASSSGRNFQEPEDPVSSHFHAWERDHLPSLSLSQNDRDHPGGTIFHPPAPARSDHSIRPMSFRRRHGSEWNSSHNRL